MKTHLWLISSLAVIAGLTACKKAVETPAQGPQAVVQTQQADDGFSQVLKSAEARLTAQMSEPLTIPVPKDAGGDEKHKDNARLMYDAGQLYKLTGNADYASFAAKILTSYADVYPDWGIHPAPKEQSPGRMFWQNLNESWWLVHASQGYGAIKDT